MLLRQTLLYLPAQVLGPVAQVVAALAWTHWLVPARYGFLTLFIANQDLIFLVCQAWWTHYTLRYLANMSGERALAFRRSELAAALLCSALQVLATCLTLLVLGDLTARGIGIAVAYVLSRSLLTHLGERARAQGHIVDYTLGQLAGSVLGLCLAYAFVATVSPTPWAVLAGFAIAQSLGASLLWQRIGLSLALARPSKMIFVAAFAYGAPLVLAGAAAWLAQNSIRVIVDSVAGATALGLIAVGWGLGQRLAGVLAMLVTSASFPLAVKQIEHGSREQGFQQLNTGGVLLIGLVLPAAIGLCFLADDFTNLFVAKVYRAVTISTLPIATLTGAVRNIRVHVVEPAFLLVERPGFTTLVNVVDAVAMSAGCVVGLKLGGLDGAVYGCLAGTLMCAAFTLFVAHRETGYSFPMKQAGKIALATLAMAMTLAVVNRALPPTTPAGLALVAKTAIGGIVYAVALLRIMPGTLQQLRLVFQKDQRVGIGVPLR